MVQELELIGLNPAGFALHNNDGLIGYVSADYLSVYDGTIPEASEAVRLFAI